MLKVGDKVYINNLMNSQVSNVEVLEVLANVADGKNYTTYLCKKVTADSVRHKIITEGEVVSAEYAESMRLANELDAEIDALTLKRRNLNVR